VTQTEATQGGGEGGREGIDEHVDARRRASSARQVADLEGRGEGLDQGRDAAAGIVRGGLDRPGRQLEVTEGAVREGEPLQGAPPVPQHLGPAQEAREDPGRAPSLALAQERVTERQSGQLAVVDTPRRLSEARCRGPLVDRSIQDRQDLVETVRSPTIQGREVSHAARATSPELDRLRRKGERGDDAVVGSAGNGDRRGLPQHGREGTPMDVPELPLRFLPADLLSEGRGIPELGA